MLKQLVRLAALSSIFVVGCAIVPENAGTLNRDEAVLDLITKAEEVGYEHQTLNTGFDEPLNIVSSILERQKNVAVNYRSKMKDHRDVISFMHANQGKTEEELKIAVENFDSLAASDDQKIGAKLDKYNNATAAIHAENVKLALDIATESAKFLMLFEQNAQIMIDTAAQIAQEKLSAKMKFPSFGPKQDEGVDKTQTKSYIAGKALLRAKEQISLARKLGGFIKIDKDLAKSLTKLQGTVEA